MRLYARLQAVPKQYQMIVSIKKQKSSDCRTTWTHNRCMCRATRSVLCSERQRDTVPSCASQCSTASRETAIWWHLVIGPTKSFKILIIDSATSRHLCSFHALYKFTMLFIASILALLTIECTHRSLSKTIKLDTFFTYITGTSRCK